MLSIFLFLYALVGMLSVRPVAGHFAWKFCSNYASQSKPDGEDWFQATVIAIFIAFFWGVIALSLIASKASSALFPVIGAEKKQLEEKKIAEREQLEKELGL